MVKIFSRLKIKNEARQVGRQTGRQAGRQAGRAQGCKERRERGRKKQEEDKCLGGGEVKRSLKKATRKGRGICM